MITKSHGLSRVRARDNISARFMRSAGLRHGRLQKGEFATEAQSTQRGTTAIVMRDIFCALCVSLDDVASRGCAARSFRVLPFPIPGAIHCAVPLCAQRAGLI